MSNIQNLARCGGGGTYVYIYIYIYIRRGDAATVFSSVLRRMLLAHYLSDIYIYTYRCIYIYIYIYIYLCVNWRCDGFCRLGSTAVHPGRPCASKPRVLIVILPYLQYLPSLGCPIRHMLINLLRKIHKQ